MTDWLELRRGDLPLIVSFPHTGTEIPPDIEERLVSAWFARKDTDWWVDRLYDTARELGASTVRTSVSRTVIDVNRDPAGGSLYPGQATTELCPLTTFDGEPLYLAGREPDAVEVARRRATFFEPYHKSLTEEISRLCAQHGRVVLYDAHSIRSRVPRLFDGALPNFNIGTHGGRACAPSLIRSIERTCRHPDFTQVTDGRFKGGWITRRYGVPSRGVHALQMELACRGYLAEPTEPLTPHNWPPAFDSTRAAALRGVLANVLRACLDFARSPPGELR